MGVNSKVWGQYLWRLLHCLTYTYQPNMPSEQKAKLIRIFHVLKDLIPCPVCRNHYTIRCNKNPPERNMANTDQFVMWLSNIHNEVNSGLGKPYVSKRQSDYQYVKNGKVQFDFRDFVVLFRIMTMINYVNFMAVQKFLELFFELVPENVLIKNAPNSYKSINNINSNMTLNIWITSFDNEFAKNKKSTPYLSNPNIVPRVVEDEVFARENRGVILTTKTNLSTTPKTPPKKNTIVKNEIDVFLKTYKII